MIFGLLSRVKIFLRRGVGAGTGYPLIWVIFVKGDTQLQAASKRGVFEAAVFWDFFPRKKSGLFLEHPEQG